jgi:hypothetical protein
MLGDGKVLSYLDIAHEAAHLQVNLSKFNLSITCDILLYVFNINVHSHINTYLVLSTNPRVIEVFKLCEISYKPTAYTQT